VPFLKLKEISPELESVTSLSVSMVKNSNQRTMPFSKKVKKVE
jgi:hypothetical protein